MQIKAIKVGSDTYNVAAASAVNQMELLKLMGASVAFKSGTSQHNIDIEFVKGALLSMPDKFDRIAELALYKAVKVGGDAGITVDDFQGRINDYLTLLAEAVHLNLSDFFGYLDSVNAQSREEMTGNNE